MGDTTKDGFELPNLDHPSSSYDEERLPLYEEHAGTDQLTLPSPEASVTEVRAFIYRCLIHGAGVDQATARDISEKWTIGTGAELRTYPFSMYYDIFGAEPAWAIYRKARTMVLEEERPAKQKKLLWLHLGCAASFTILLLSAIIAGHTDHLPMTIITGLLAVYIIVPWVVFGFALAKSPQTLVEQELKSAQADRGKKQSR